MSIDLPKVFGHNGQMSIDGTASWTFGPYRIEVLRRPNYVGSRAWAWGINMNNVALLKGTADSFRDAVDAVKGAAIEQLRIWSDIVRPAGRPRVFISSPFRADSVEGLERNIAIAREACVQVESGGGAPFAPHLLFPQFLPEECAWRESVASWLAAANSLHVVGPVVSPGMQEEIDLANQFRVPITGHVPQ